MSETDAYTDVVELCAILQCLGFAVKSLDTIDGNMSQDGGARTVTINCQISGLQVVLESASLPCTCPPTSENNSGFWQVSGIAGGKMQSKETGSSLLGSLPRAYRDKLSKELQDMVRTIKEQNESEVERVMVNKSASLLELGHANKSASLVDLAREGINKSESMVELGTPEKVSQQLKVDTPTRYRSLDTLTAKDGLFKKLSDASANPENDSLKERCKALSHRHSTYTVCSTASSTRKRNKTSSPIHGTQPNMLDSLIHAEKKAEDLRNMLNNIVREFLDNDTKDSSMSSLVLDVSKISVLKGPEASRAQFASSPNLSGLVAREELAKSQLRRFESVSTSNLGSKAIESKSRLRKFSPSLFKTKSEVFKGDKSVDGKNRLQNLFRPKIVTPVRVPKQNIEASPKLSSLTKKKYSHIKSTIPRPNPKKE